MAMENTAFRARPAAYRHSTMAAGWPQRAEKPLLQAFLRPSSVKATDRHCIKVTTTIDFACGTDTSLIDIDDISSTIESFLKGQYIKDASLKTPSPDIWNAAATDSMKIPKWFGTFNLSPSRRDIALQKVKLEIAPVPAHSHTFMQPINHYSSYGFESKLPPIKVETIDEIMADSKVCFSRHVQKEVEAH